MQLDESKYIIAIDFDGTCVAHEYPHIGKDIGAVPVLQRIVRAGHYLILNTMRANNELLDAVQWFRDNGIKLSGVNKTPGQELWTQSPKVYAHLYIDDAGIGAPLVIDQTVSEKPFMNWPYVTEMLEFLGLISV
jgi:hypothetical protein